MSKLFPPPVQHCELETWEDWSWQLSQYARLYKPFAKRRMDDVEDSQRVTADDSSEPFDLQQTGAQNSELLWKFSSRQRACWRRSLMVPLGRFFEMRAQNGLGKIAQTVCTA